MKSALKRILCQFLVISMVLLPFQTGQASMIGTDQAVAVASAQADRDLVSSFLARSQAQSELQSMGIDAKTAKDRVASMTDAEVGTLAGKIRSMPAGAGTAEAVLLIVVVGFLIWWFAMRK